MTQASTDSPRTHQGPPPRQGLAWVVGLVILCFVWRIQDLFPILGAIKLPILSMLVAGIWAIFNGAYRKLWPLIRRDRSAQLATALLVLMVVGVPFSLYTGRSFNFILKDHLRTLLLMLVIASSVRAMRDVERLVLVNLVGAAIFCFITVTRYTVGVNGRLDELEYYDANDLAMLVVMMLPFAFLMLLKSSRASVLVRLFALLCVPLFLLAIVKTGSRGGFLALVAVALYALFRFEGVKVGTRVAAVVLGIGGLFALGGDTYASLMKTLLNPKADYNWSGNAETGRMEVWKRGTSYMLSNPVLGVGVRCFSVAEGTISNLASRQNEGVGLKWSEAHNSFVQIGAELGVTGLLLFLGMLGTAVMALARVRKPSVATQRPPMVRAYSHAFTASIIGYVTAAVFLSQAYAAAIYVILGMVVAFVRVSSTPAPRCGVRVATPPLAFAAS